MKKFLTMVVIPAAALLAAVPSPARAGLVNGSFDQYTGGYNGYTSQIGNTIKNTDGSSNGYTALTGWTVGNGTYGFLMAPGQADTTGAYSPQFGSTFKLWGSNDSNPATDKGVATLPATSPDGGHYLVLDGASNYRGTGIFQTLSGLTVGQQYAVSFYWASGQQYGYDGATDEWLQVNFGSSLNSYQSQSTAHASNVSHGFTNWAKQTFVFTADATSDTLNFLAMSNSGGLPPLVLLDGVTFNAVPEPASLAMVGLGLGGVALARRVRRGKNLQA